MDTTPTHLPIHAPDRERTSFAGRSITRKAAILMAVAAAMPLTVQVAQAGEGGGSYETMSIAQKEIARRAALVKRADEALLLGRAAYANQDYEEALKQYKIAVSLLPPGPALADRRNAYLAHLGDATNALAQKYRRIGKYDEARDMLNGVLKRDPANFNSKKQLEYLDDPIRTNQALTFEHTQNVEKVRKHLYIGEGAYNLGKFDEAEAEFKAVLLIDPYNSAARRWMERVDAARSRYYRTAYNQTRAHLLAEVDKAWEMAVPAETPQFVDNTPMGEPTTGVQKIRQKLNTIIIPVVDFDNTTVEEAIDFIRLRSRELDPEGEGINIIVRTSSVAGSGESMGEEGDDTLGGDGSEDVAASETRRIKELKLRDMPLASVLQYICDATRLRYKIDEHTVILLPLDSVDGADLYTRSFVVPPDFIARLSDGSTTEAAEEDPFGGGGNTGAVSIGQRKKAIDLLRANGVGFPPKAFANYIGASSTLVVRNTLENLDVIEQIIAAIRGKGPRQVRILTKFIEISQENSDELSFDWILSPVGGANASTFLGGGTIGNGSPRLGRDFGTPTVTGIGAPNNPVSNIGTSGLRSGDYAISRNSIDAILNNPTRTSQNSNVAPGILSLTGLYNDGQVQMIMRGLAQKKGADVMTAPSILARSGETAKIEVIREFIYPTAYDPPELPNSVGANAPAQGAGGQQAPATFPVTPATPTEFETRNTGVTLEIKPTIDDKGYTIDLTFIPEIVEFEGFINYGSPIQSPATDALGNPIQVTITENRIEMPVFSTRRVTTAITIYDGYTVSVGGLMSEHVQNVEDKVPILGDLPIIGRLFQSKAENHIKSNLVIFVTAEIIDASGKRVNVNTGSGDAPGIDVPGVGPAPAMGADNGDLFPTK